MLQGALASQGPFWEEPIQSPPQEVSRPEGVGVSSSDFLAQTRFSHPAAGLLLVVVYRTPLAEEDRWYQF